MYGCPFASLTPLNIGGVRLSSGVNDTLLVIGYGSLLSGYGMLAERRGGKSRLIACDAFPVRLLNARRGLAKPSSHGHYAVHVRISPDISR